MKNADYEAPCYELFFCSWHLLSQGQNVLLSIFISDAHNICASLKVTSVTFNLGFLDKCNKIHIRLRLIQC
jgi:hypothetical protein